jgi:hypothetical protein
MKLLFLVAAAIFGCVGVYQGLVLQDYAHGGFFLALGAYNYAVYLSDTKVDRE